MYNIYDKLWGDDITNPLIWIFIRTGQEMFSEKMWNFKMSQLPYFLSDFHHFCTNLWGNFYSFFWNYVNSGLDFPFNSVCALHYYQLGTFSVNGEWAYSPFVTNSGHADNPTTFVPCVKSMAAGFNRKIHNFPHGGLPYKSVRRILVRISPLTANKPPQTHSPFTENVPNWLWPPLTSRVTYLHSGYSTFVNHHTFTACR